MVTYRNTFTGRVVERDEPDPLMDASRRWQRVEPEPVEVFDPAAHTVHDVNDHLADADLAERERVLAAEAEGKARSTILTGPYGRE